MAGVHNILSIFSMAALLILCQHIQFIVSEDNCEEGTFTVERLSFLDSQNA